jgi:hypothetical protein
MLTAAYPASLSWGYRIHYQRSVQDAIEETTSQNKNVVVYSYGIMLIYVWLALGHLDRVRSRLLLALNGLAIVALSVTSALGIVR